MNVVLLSEAQDRIDAVMQSVVDDHAPIVVARPQGASVVIVSLEDWEAMEETNYLLSTSANAERLRVAVAEVDGGRWEEHELIRE